MKGSPSRAVSESVAGLKSSLPAIASAVTISGLARKFIVARRAVVAAGEVAVVRGDDRVGRIRRHVRPAPLADAGAAGVGEHLGADVLQGLQLAVPLDRRSGLARSRA